MPTKYIAVRVDNEYNAEEWWDSLREQYPAFAQALQQDGHAVIASSLWDALIALPGFCGGPDYAECALIDCGNEGDMWCDVVASKHAVFDELR